jgi:hypothetical protein
MLVNKILKNQILKIVKEAIGVNDNKWELRKITNELRIVKSQVNRQKSVIEELRKISHLKRNLVKKDGEYYLEEDVCK